MNADPWPPWPGPREGWALGPETPVTPGPRPVLSGVPAVTGGAGAASLVVLCSPLPAPLCPGCRGLHLPRSLWKFFPGSSSSKATCWQSHSPEPATAALLSGQNCATLRPGPHSLTKIRKPNFSPQETEVLAQRVMRHYPLLFVALRGPPAQKHRVWRQILQAVNALGHCRRGLGDLKHKWQDLRGLVCKKLAERPPVPGLVLTPVERMVAETFSAAVLPGKGPACEPLPSKWVLPTAGVSRPPLAQPPGRGRECRALRSH